LNFPIELLSSSVGGIVFFLAGAGIASKYIKREKENNYIHNHNNNGYAREKENREDHQIIFNKLDGLQKGIAGLGERLAKIEGKLEK